MTPLMYCQHKSRESGSSFLSGFYFLPQYKKDAMTVLYAYCRELDDVVDECSDGGVAKTTLSWWRQDLDKVFEKDTIPEHPVNQALKEIVVSFSLPKEELGEIINGMEMDLHHVRYIDFEELKYYCYRVAGVVGRLIARILGFQNQKTLEYAETLGLALQLTNIIRDVGEDARQGRIYLPMDELQRFNVPAQTILSYIPTPEFAELMAFQVQRAEEMYQKAVALLPDSEKKSQRVGLIMGAIYYALLAEIKADGAENVLQYKIRLPSPRKMRIALKTALLGFKP